MATPVPRPFDVARFFRLGATRFALAWVARSGGTGFSTDEGWVPASGPFAVRSWTAGYRDDYVDDYNFVSTYQDAMAAVASAWAANKTESDATLMAAVNLALRGRGFTRPNGDPVT